VSDAVLAGVIAEIHERSRGTYGAPGCRPRAVRPGRRSGRKRVARCGVSKQPTSTIACAFRDDSLRVDVVVPSERWEIGLTEHRGTEVERFTSSGDIADETELEVLFRNVSD
jgi:hypothetical protein